MMNLMTDAIRPNGYFDSRYTCDIDNSSPEIRWEHPPEGTAAFALIAEDPDAPHGLFTHWVIHNIPAEVRHLPAGIPPQEALPNGIHQGANSYGKLGYAGPCPPPGDRAHRYLFKLYALTRQIKLPPASTVKNFSRRSNPSLSKKPSSRACIKERFKELDSIWQQADNYVTKKTCQKLSSSKPGKF